MALIDSMKGLDLVAVADSGPFCRLAGDGLSTVGLDIVAVFLCGPFVGTEGEAGPPPEPGALSRYFPVIPAERTFPAVPAERMFPL
jgi:hypothetical protein